MFREKDTLYDFSVPQKCRLYPHGKKIALLIYLQHLMQVIVYAFIYFLAKLKKMVMVQKNGAFHFSVLQKCRFYPFGKGITLLI